MWLVANWKSIKPPLDGYFVFRKLLEPIKDQFLCQLPAIFTYSESLVPFAMLINGRNVLWLMVVIRFFY